MRYYKYLCSNCGHQFVVWNGSTPCPKCGVDDVLDITTKGEAAGIGVDKAAVIKPARPDEHRVILQVLDTLEWGNKKHGSEFASAHEAIAVLREEYLELEQEVFHGTDRRRIREEALQVAAVAIKLVMHVDGGNYGANQ